MPGLGRRSRHGCAICSESTPSASSTRTIRATTCCRRRPSTGCTSDIRPSADWRQTSGKTSSNTTEFWSKVSSFNIRSNSVQKKIELLLQPYNNSVMTSRFMRFDDDDAPKTLDSAEDNWR